MLAQWRRALCVVADGPGRERLAAAIAFHARRQELPDGVARRAGALAARLPAYARAPGGWRALTWDVTSPVVLRGVAEDPGGA